MRTLIRPPRGTLDGSHARTHVSNAEYIMPLFFASHLCLFCISDSDSRSHMDDACMPRPLTKEVLSKGLIPCMRVKQL